MEASDQKTLAQATNYCSNLAIYQSASVALLSGLLIAVFAAATLAIAILYWTPVDIADVTQRFIPRWHYYLKPEPLERAAYLGAVASAFPVTIMSALIIVKNWGTNRFSRLTAILPLAISLFFTSCFFGGRFARYIFTGAQDGVVGIFETPLWTQVLIAALLSHLMVRFGNWQLFMNSGKWVDSALTILALCLAAIRIRTPGMVYGEINLEAVLYSVTQVSAGHTVLVDLPAQYGLYAEVLGPILKLTGLSVVGFTCVLAILHAVALLALLYSAANIISSPVLRLLAGLTIFLFVGSTWRQIWHSPTGFEYPQIWPIRALFPMLTLGAFAIVHRRGMQLHDLLAMGLLAGLAIVWNFDWGIPAYGALVAFFLLDFLTTFPLHRRSAALKLAMVIIIPVLFTALFLVYLVSKSGTLIDPLESIKYLRLFYGSGFGMLPIPGTLHPWMAVFGLYIVGIALGVTARVIGRETMRSDTIFVLSIIGIGIFTYYQGRSHDVVLSFVLWPSVLIAFAIVDCILGRKSISPLIAYTTLPVITLGLLSSFLMLGAIPRFFSFGVNLVSALKNSEPTAVTSDIEFVRARTKEEKSAVILSPAQSLLFAETGLMSAVRGPGVIETLLAEDENKMITEILTEKPANVFIEAQAGSIPEPYLRLMSEYEVIDASGSGLLYLQPAH